MKRKINIPLYLIMSVFIVISGFCGYFMGEYINLTNDKFTEIDTGEYVAKANVVVNYSLDSLANDDSKMSSTEISSAVRIAENVSIIFNYSQEIQNLIPAGYKLTIESVNDSNVLCLMVKGKEPSVCASVVNNIREKASEVFAKYYSDGKMQPLGYDSSVPTETIKEKVEKEPISSVLIALIGILIGAFLFVLCAIKNEKFINTVCNTEVAKQTIVY